MALIIVNINVSQNRHKFGYVDQKLLPYMSRCEHPCTKNAYFQKQIKTQIIALFGTPLLAKKEKYFSKTIQFYHSLYFILSIHIVLILIIYKVSTWSGVDSHMFKFFKQKDSNLSN